MILDKRKEVSDGKESSFRSFKEQVELKKKKFGEWNEKMREKMASGVDRRQVVAQTKERKRLDILEELIMRKVFIIYCIFSSCHEVN